MLIYLYNLFWNWKTKNKILPQPLFATFILNFNLSKDYSDKTYYELCKKIRNLTTLSKEDILYLQSLSQENLIDIILLYNNHSKNLDEYFENSSQNT
jgi:hypothetical protein